MRCIAIAGVGLIGGSMGLALRKAGFDGEILGVSSPATIRQAVSAAAIDRGVSLEEAARVADVLYLAQPISGILETIRRLKPIARPDCLVTDAGSTKSAIVAAAAGLPLFLGGHPMAGKESRGVSSADADLFHGKTYVLTPGPEGRDEAHRELTHTFVKWISLCGAVPVFFSPAEHDRLVAFTSHVPQLMSTALGSVLAAHVTESRDLSVSGSGLRDMLRLASSSWDIWRDILVTNKENIEHALNVYIDKLTEMRENLQTSQQGEEFLRAAEFAKELRRWANENREGSRTCE